MVFTDAAIPLFPFRGLLAASDWICRCESDMPITRCIETTGNHDRGPFAPFWSRCLVVSGFFSASLCALMTVSVTRITCHVLPV